MKLTGKIDISEIKRCYIEATLKINCPDCGHVMEDDLNEQYLMYPGGEKHERYLSCFNCGDDENEVSFTLPIKFMRATIELEYDPTCLVKQ